MENASVFRVSIRVKGVVVMMMMRVVAIRNSIPTRIYLNREVATIAVTGRRIAGGGQ